MIGKNYGASTGDLVDVYVKQVRCLLELAVAAWQGSITKAEKSSLERVQKSAVRIILGNEYSSYQNSLETLKMEDLESRRIKLCLKFGRKAESHPKHKNWFVSNNHSLNTRNKQKYKNVHFNHTRFKNSPICYLTDLLNKYS